MSKIKRILKNNWKRLIVPVLILLVWVLGMTYAYFSIQVEGNEEASSMTVQTASLILRYIDGPEITLEGAYPGAYVEKEVKVQNIGTVGVTYAIGFVDMEHNFLNDELVVSYTCTSYINYGQTNQIESGNCYPLVAQPIDEEEPGIEEGIYIGVGITQVYTIRIEFLEIGSAQDYNQGAHFEGTINIGETLESFTLLAQVLYEDNSPCANCTAEVNPDTGQAAMIPNPEGYKVQTLGGTGEVQATQIARARSAVTDENGIFIMPKVSQGVHRIVIRDSSGNLVMQGGIEIRVAAQATIDENVIAGVKGAEEVGVVIRVKEETSEIKEISEMSLFKYAFLTVDLGGGQTTQTFDRWYVEGTTLTLTEPTKNGDDVFKGWMISNTNSRITDNIITFGDSPVTLTAKWETSFEYTGNYQTFTAPREGYYEIEAWGAQGGRYTAGKGAHTSGKIYLEKGAELYVYVGQSLTTGYGTSFNGGISISGSSPGGGATDIRLVSGDWHNPLSLNSRIMVAAGSGAGTGNTTTLMGAGGGLIGHDGDSVCSYGDSYRGYGSTQIDFSIANVYADPKFGIGGGGCGGGGGYYGGTGAVCVCGGGGGSSFISGYAGAAAIIEGSTTEPRDHTTTYINSNGETVELIDTKHYSGKYFVDGQMEAGVNTGNGRASVTYLGSTLPRANTALNNVRYIKDCINGTNNHWVELQAIVNGTNVAKGKVGTLYNDSNEIVSAHASYPFNRITDGDITSENYSRGIEDSGNQCFVIDLGNNQDLDEVAVWHDWSDGSTYNDNITSVSNDGTNWTTIYSFKEAETYQGKRVSAYRKSNLYTNGYLELKNNTNFSAFTYNSGGYFSRSGNYTILTGDEYVPVNPIKTYKVTLTAKANNTLTRQYAGIAEYDADMRRIESQHVKYVPETLTTLAQDLTIGDEAIVVANLSNFVDYLEDRNRSIIFWNYVDSTGYQYPELTYSRNWYQNVWAYNENALNMTTNTISLSAPWTGGTIPAGTKLSQGGAGAGYNYGILDYDTLSTNWTTYYNTMTGYCSNGAICYNKFKYGTKYIKFFIGFNYSKTPDTTVYLKDIGIKEY